MCSTQHIVIKGPYSHLYSLLHTYKSARDLLLHCTVFQSWQTAFQSYQEMSEMCGTNLQTNHISYYQITHHKANDITVVQYSPYQQCTYVCVYVCMYVHVTLWWQQYTIIKPMFFHVSVQAGLCVL